MPFERRQRPSLLGDQVSRPAGASGLRLRDGRAPDPAARRDVNLRSAADARVRGDRLWPASRPMLRSMLDWSCGLLGLGPLCEPACTCRRSTTAAPDRPTPSLAAAVGIRAYVSSDPRRLPYATGGFARRAQLRSARARARLDASLDEDRPRAETGRHYYVYKLPNRHSYLEAIAKRIGLYYHGAEPHELLYTPGSARAAGRTRLQITELRLANMLPLTLDAPIAQRAQFVSRRVASAGRWRACPASTRRHERRARGDGAT